MIKDHVTLYGNVNNISRGGVLVFLDEKLKVGTNVRLAIEISDCHDIITARDAVVSTHIAPGVGKHGVSFSIVLKFKKLPRKT